MTLTAQLQALADQYGAAQVLTAAHALLKCECKRCGNTWTPRTNNVPAQCPACKSAYWQIAKEA